MIDENLFTTEIRIPEEFESMLNVSIKHEKLQSVMKFIIEVLQRHEKGLKQQQDKTKHLGPEIKFLGQSIESLNTRLVNQDCKVSETLDLFHNFEEELSKKLDSSESLKYTLEMITKHDFSLSLQKKEIEDLKQGSEKILKNLNDLEKLSKTFQSNLDKLANDKIAEKRRISKVSARIIENVEESAALHRNDSSYLSEFKEEVPLKIQLQEIEERRSGLAGVAVEGKKIFFDDRMRNEEKRVRNENSGQDEKIFVNDEKVARTRYQPHIYEAIFPFPNKNYSETEKNLLLSPENASDSKSPSRLNVILPSRIKHLEHRLDIIERVLAESEPAFFFNKLEHMEKTFKFYESALDKLEPEIMKNKLNIRKLVDKTSRLEREMIQKTSTDQFDSFKNLVLALASGSSRKTLPKMDSVSAYDVNFAENFRKRLEELEEFYMASKITSINFEEISYKLVRIEQKLDFKLDASELDLVNQNIHNLNDRIKVVQHEDGKGFVTKPGDAVQLASLNRKILQLEAQLKMFSLPPGLSFQTISEEIKKLWESIKLLLSSLESYTSTFNTKFSELSLTGFAPSIDKIKKNVESEIRSEIQQICDDFDKKFADKFEMLRGFKYVESVLNKIEGKIRRADAEEAILARKPLAGWTCGSCDKNLDKLSGRTAAYVPWGKLPVRDPKERIIKAGNGFGNMVLQLEPIKRRGESMASMTERSVTPTPMV